MTQPNGAMRAAMDAARGAFDSRLPDRYEGDFWRRPFNERLEVLIAPDQWILDVGAGANPVVPIEERPKGVEYVGLDLSPAEMERAPRGSYDEKVVSPAETPVRSLMRRFDLVVSWLAMEHVLDVGSALANISGYLRPGGSLLALLAGRFSPFSMANRILPHAVTRRILMRTQGRAAESVFPARYDRCWQSALEEEMAASFADWEVRPIYMAVPYVSFSPVLSALYIGYEEWAYRGDHRNLAPYYLLEGSVA
jgi:SAM-dependent methyltransferase